MKRSFFRTRFIKIEKFCFLLWQKCQKIVAKNKKDFWRRKKWKTNLSSISEKEKLKSLKKKPLSIKKNEKKPVSSSLLSLKQMKYWNKNTAAVLKKMIKQTHEWNPWLDCFDDRLPWTPKLFPLETFSRKAFCRRRVSLTGWLSCDYLFFYNKHVLLRFYCLQKNSNNKIHDHTLQAKYVKSPVKISKAFVNKKPNPRPKVEQFWLAPMRKKSLIEVVTNSSSSHLCALRNSEWFLL